MSAAPVQEIVELASKLVQAPSRGGEDDPAAVISVAESAMRHVGLGVRVLETDGKPVALMAKIAGAKPGPTWVLNACIDTAGIGDRSAWTVEPFGGLVRDGKLWGRGASDSKIAVASFIHLGGQIAREGIAVGEIVIMFDADEHTGHFGGIRRFIAERPDIAGVMVGYPENEAVNIGARGFWRAEITMHGEAEHSGRPWTPKSNAVVKIARLIAAFERVTFEPATAEFPLTPKITVTGISGGAPGYTNVPDGASLRVDFRLTPTFPADAADAVVTKLIAEVEEGMPASRPPIIARELPWGPYRLADDNRLARALIDGATKAMGAPVPGIVCGPSNIANFLADRGIPATCGFGVTCSGVHGADEWAMIDDVPLIWTAYGHAARTLTAG